VSIGPLVNNNIPHPPPHTCDYLVANLTSPPPTTTSTSTGDSETSFSRPPASSLAAVPAVPPLVTSPAPPLVSSFRPGYTRLPPPSHPPPHPCRGRQPSVEEPQGTVQESLSTDPLLPRSPSGGSLASPIPPPSLYTDHVLPLNPASLHSAATAASAARSVPGAGPRTSLYAVTNDANTAVESKTFNSSEISV